METLQIIIVFGIFCLIYLFGKKHIDERNIQNKNTTNDALKEKIANSKITDYLAQDMMTQNEKRQNNFIEYVNEMEKEEQTKEEHMPETTKAPKTNIIQKLKSLPRENYHIFGYITFIYFVYVTFDSWDYGMDYEYYELLRWVVMSFSVWTTIRIYKNNPKSIWFLIFLIIAILFNPIAKIPLEREIWQKVDVATIACFLIYANKNKLNMKKMQ